MTRPEANLAGLGYLGVAALALPKGERKKFVLGCIYFYVLPGSAYFVWRAVYYGHLLPLPFYIKSGRLSLAGVPPAYMFLKNAAIGLLLPACLALSTKRALVLLPLLPLAIYFLTVEHLMGYGSRYFFPFTPVLALAGGLALAELARNLEEGPRRKLNIALLAWLLAASVLGIAGSREARGDYIAYAKSLEGAHISLGKALGRMEGHEDLILAMDDAGAAPYYSRMKVMDTFGLNEPNIATGDPSNKNDYILSKSPDLLIVISESDQRFRSKRDQRERLYEAALKEGYIEEAQIRFNDSYFLWAMWKPGGEQAARLRSLLDGVSRKSHEPRRTGG